jgi:hypothetical protein
MLVAMSNDLRPARLYTVADLERVFEQGGHKSGSADMKVLEFFYEPLMRRYLDDDATIAYGMYLELGDIKHAGVWVHAMGDLLNRCPNALKRVRLRPKLSYAGLATMPYELAQAVDRLRNMTVKLLREEPPGEVNERLNALVAMLDRSR